jgi:tRNA dimethylallyltransferase
MKCLIAIVGPTATGKSIHAISIAQKYSGEIVNADSRQIYKYMDIGTAKPGIAEYRQIPHHLFDIIYPDEPYSVALYQHSAIGTIKDIQSRKGLPLLVGGSGQYIWSIIEGWTIPEVEPDKAFRDMLEKEVQSQGAQELYDRLKSIDPIAASKILPANARRVIRALEIYQQTGKKPSELQKKTGLPYPFFIIGLTRERNSLYKVIDKRVDSMISCGFIEEVQKLLKLGYSYDLPSMYSLGYREISQYLRGELKKEEACQKIKFETHRFARSQYTWFRSADKRITWFNLDNDVSDKINYTIRTFLSSL